MTFYCAQCRYRGTFGFPPWENCLTCAKVNAVLADAPPYQPPDEPPPYVPPEPTLWPRYAPRKPAWSKPRIWYPMREREREPGRDWNNPQEYGYEGRGDPELPYELFNDMDIPREARAKMKAQYEVAILNMPDDDWVAIPPFTSKKRKQLKVE